MEYEFLMGLIAMNHPKLGFVPFCAKLSTNCPIQEWNMTLNGLKGQYINSNEIGLNIKSTSINSHSLQYNKFIPPNNIMSSSTKFVLFSILMMTISFPSMILCQFEEQFQNNPFIEFTKELGSAQKAKQFLKITTNSSLTNAELVQKLEEFARENGVTAALRKLNETANRMKDQIMDAAPQNLAGPAFQTFNQIIGILSDETQTRGKACDQVRSVLNETDPVVRHFLPKGLGISCLGVGNDPLADKIKAQIGGGKFGQIGSNIGKFFGIPKPNNN